jgi:hypothetical protein
MYTKSKEEQSAISEDTVVELPKSLRNWFEAPDHWSKNRESLAMQNEWLSAERDEVVQYVKLLKKMALYLARKTEGNTDRSLLNFFQKAEQSFPDYLCNEIAISLSDGA